MEVDKTQKYTCITEPRKVPKITEMSIVLCIISDSFDKPRIGYRHGPMPRRHNKGKVCEFREIFIVITHRLLLMFAEMNSSSFDHWCRGCICKYTFVLVCTSIRLLMQEQFDLGLHCFPLYLHCHKPNILT